jgi:hypothetical protein
MIVDKFWIVYRVTGSGSGYSNTRHTTESTAIAEAERLAGVHTGQIFVILETTRACRVLEPVTWVDCTAP